MTGSADPTAPYAIRFPNIRARILPDPGFTLIEADLARADAQVCAWDAGATRLKALLASGEDIHTTNAARIYSVPASEALSVHINGQSFRQNAKQAVHLTNYGGGANTLASALAIDEETAAQFIHWWTREEHPEIHHWHERIYFNLTNGPPCVYNIYGFRRLYADRVTPLILPQALAWIGQSTVAIVTCIAMREIHAQLPHDTVRILINGHDSILVEARTERLHWAMAQISRIFDAIVVPYDDPLVIPHELKISHVNWGSMHAPAPAAQLELAS